MDAKVAIVTGASRGIGAAIAKTLASKGIYVVIGYSGNEQKAKEVLEDIEKAGGHGSIYGFNVASEEECKQLIDDTVKEMGRLDILVNNAGITRDNLVMAMKKKDFQDVIDVNLVGTYQCIRFASRYMIKNRYGRIVNMSSVSGVVGNPGQANYAASKAGVIGLTKSVAKELAARNVHVNAVAPGFIETDMTDVLSAKVKETAMDQIPCRRFGTPQDVANVVMFLVSEQADYITGQVISVDGGMAI